MGFPESVLTADERVVSHLHPHWKALIRPILIFLVAVAVVVVASIFLPVAGWAKPTLLAIGALAVVAVIWFSLWPWLVWRTTHYVLTNERVIMRRGVFSRAGRDIPLGRINDVSFSHTLLERMLGCGTLTIESAGERGQVVLTDIPGVEKIQSVLYELVDDDRAKHTFDDGDRDAIVRSVREQQDR
jgi:uncharacterized membrane protein YdbT with pleckstrin-like domain